MTDAEAAGPETPDGDPEEPGTGGNGRAGEPGRTGRTDGTGESGGTADSDPVAAAGATGTGDGGADGDAGGETDEGAAADDATPDSGQDDERLRAAVAAWAATAEDGDAPASDSAPEDEPDDGEGSVEPPEEVAAAHA
ncbi:MAG TPA: hypothetical protein DEQ61_03865, partial [Streptomyces sp.]|nr:hypothetical protein [Streptomyces sp.]